MTRSLILYYFLSALCIQMSTSYLDARPPQSFHFYFDYPLVGNPAQNSQLMELALQDLLSAVTPQADETSRKVFAQGLAEAFFTAHQGGLYTLPFVQDISLTYVEEVFEGFLCKGRTEYYQVLNDPQIAQAKKKLLYDWLSAYEIVTQLISLRKNSVKTLARGVKGLLYGVRGEEDKNEFFLSTGKELELSPEEGLKGSIDDVLYEIIPHITPEEVMQLSIALEKVFGIVAHKCKNLKKDMIHHHFPLLTMQYLITFLRYVIEPCHVEWIRKSEKHAEYKRLLLKKWISLNKALAPLCASPTADLTSKFEKVLYPPQSTKDNSAIVAIVKKNPGDMPQKEQQPLPFFAPDRKEGKREKAVVEQQKETEATFFQALAPHAPKYEIKKCVKTYHACMEEKRTLQLETEVHFLQKPFIIYKKALFALLENAINPEHFAQVKKESDIAQYKRELLQNWLEVYKVMDTQVNLSVLYHTDGTWSYSHLYWFSHALTVLLYGEHHPR